MSEFPHIENKSILVLANYDVGLYKFRRALLEALLGLGNVVYVSLPQGELVPELEKLGCRFIETPLERRGMNPLRDIRLYRRYCRILKEVKPDLVITYTIKPNIYGGAACRKMHIPYVANITGLGSAIAGGGPLQKLVFSMYRFALQKAGTVFFENEGNRDVLVQAGVVRAEQVCVLHGAGIETGDYTCARYPAESPVRFLFVGRIMQEKGVDELFAAFERIRAEYGDAVMLDVVGIFEEAYEEKIAELQARNAIVFHGYQKDVKPFYEQAHCIVLPSYHEGMSNVLLEAASMGRPLITSRIHGCMEAVEENVSGLLCEPKNAEDLYGAMKRFLALSHAEKEAMGRAGRARMEAIFDKKKVVEATLSALPLPEKDKENV